MKKKRKRKRKGKECYAVESINGYWRKLAACNGFEYGSSSISCEIARGSDRNESKKPLEKPDRGSVLHKYSIKGKEFVADFD